jgi:hypothetical protein
MKNVDNRIISSFSMEKINFFFKKKTKITHLGNK